MDSRLTPNALIAGRLSAEMRIGNDKRRRQLLYPSVMWITFAGFRIYPAMEREKYSAPA
jgi:hypothetical protein